MYELSDIKKLRKRIGLTQHQLALKAGVSQSMLAKIETGKISPGYEKVKSIFSALDHISKKKEIKAGQLATRRVLTLGMADTISSAIKKMSDHNISQMPVMDRGMPVGLVTETIILDKISRGIPTAGHVVDIMEGAPPTVSEESSLDAITGLLRHFPLVLVSRKGQVIGVITKSDVLTKAERR